MIGALLRVNTSLSTNLPNTLRTIGIGTNKTAEDAQQNVHHKSLQDKYNELKELYIQETGNEPPV